ncbi:MAG: DUF4976 domain-containing protein, partial [Verrucomicrobiales bacterium]|nr:DUF4976 domain-containing protein [Verrucomicrobiales bacterium]
PPGELEGVSLVPLLRDPLAEWNRPAFSQVQFREVPGRSVRTERWRYNEWGENGKDGIELYDQEKDPGEMQNLAGNPEYDGILKTMKETLQRNWP